MSLPELTHLQFLIMGALLDGEQSGQEVRNQLAKSRVRKSGPAFYQLMARLEDARFVAGRYDQKIIQGQIIKERRYKLTGPGVRAWQNARDFYASYADRPLPGRLAHA
jgi:hypothetical protein